VTADLASPGKALDSIPVRQPPAVGERGLVLGASSWEQYRVARIELRELRQERALQAPAASDLRS
jgi:hypothetical protein